MMPPPPSFTLKMTHFSCMYVYDDSLFMHVFSSCMYSVSVLPFSSCRSAVLFLPLLDYHLSRLSVCLEPLCSSSAGGSDSAAIRAIALTKAAPTNEPGRLEGAGLTGFSVDETGLAALRLLYLLVSHSDEVMS